MLVFLAILCRFTSYFCLGHFSLFRSTTPRRGIFIFTDETLCLFFACRWYRRKRLHLAGRFDTCSFRWLLDDLLRLLHILQCTTQWLSNFLLKGSLAIETLTDSPLLFFLLLLFLRLEVQIMDGKINDLVS